MGNGLKFNWAQVKIKGGVIISKILIQGRVFKFNWTQLSCTTFQLEQFEADTRSQGEAIHRMLFRCIKSYPRIGSDYFVLKVATMERPESDCWTTNKGSFQPPRV